MDQDANRERIEALTLEWVSWLTDAAHKWTSQQTLKIFQTSVAKSCKWVGFSGRGIDDNGVFVVNFGVPAELILRDLPGVELNDIVGFINTEPGGQIGAKLQTDAFGETFIVLERYYYIPVEHRDNWLEAGVIPERELALLKPLAEFLDTDASPELRRVALRRMLDGTDWLPPPELS